MPIPKIASPLLLLLILLSGGSATAQTGEQRVSELLDVVAAARGLADAPSKGGGAPPPPADDDGDGVANDSDLCPDTPAGEAVDGDGCSESQRDPEAAVRQVYEEDVNRLIVSAEGGCTGSGCHGRAGAPGGLRLYGAGETNSLTLNYESFVRYIANNSADRLTTKISGGLDHNGGPRYPAGSQELTVISDWAVSVEALPQ